MKITAEIVIAYQKASYGPQGSIKDGLAAVAPLIAAQVREECAKVADDEDSQITYSGEDRNVAVGQRVAKEIAAAIRNITFEVEK